jgi:hypothetical protein
MEPKRAQTVRHRSQFARHYSTLHPARPPSHRRHTSTFGSRFPPSAASFLPGSVPLQDLSGIAGPCFDSPDAHSGTLSRSVRRDSTVVRQHPTGSSAQLHADFGIPAVVSGTIGDHFGTVDAYFGIIVRSVRNCFRMTRQDFALNYLLL